MLMKMYSYTDGIVETEIQDTSWDFALTASNGQVYTRDGKFVPQDKYPTLISLEQAEKQGLVRRHNGEWEEAVREVNKTLLFFKKLWSLSKLSFFVGGFFTGYYSIQYPLMGLVVLGLLVFMSVPGADNAKK
jgi:hypothetical protein